MPKVRSNESKDKGFWVFGSCEVSEGITLHWTLEPLELAVSRPPSQEMRIATRQAGAATFAFLTHAAGPLQLPSVPWISYAHDPRH